MLEAGSDLRADELLFKNAYPVRVVGSGVGVIVMITEPAPEIIISLAVATAAAELT